MRKHRFSRGGEGGAATFEMAIAFPILLVLAVGAAELGFAIVDWLAVSNATREGARVGSSVGNHPAADTTILDSVGEALAGLENSDVLKVEIFKAAADGSVIDPTHLLNEYTPDGVGGWSCTNGCPWFPTGRSVSVTSLDRLGVRVSFQHDWVTGLLPLGAGLWSDDAVMRLEPEVNP